MMMMFSPLSTSSAALLADRGSNFFRHGSPFVRAAVRPVGGRRRCFALVLPGHGRLSLPSGAVRPGVFVGSETQ
jgi:hypothetical protein